MLVDAGTCKVSSLLTSTSGASIESSTGVQDVTALVPVLLISAMMVFTSNIEDGLAAGLVAYRG
jgi:hypothetical protein